MTNVVGDIMYVSLGFMVYNNHPLPPGARHCPQSQVVIDHKSRAIIMLQFRWYSVDVEYSLASRSAGLFFGILLRPVLLAKESFTLGILISSCTKKINTKPSFNSM